MRLHKVQPLENIKKERGEKKKKGPELSAGGAKWCSRSFNFHLVDFYELNEGGPMTVILCLVALRNCFLL